MEPEADPLHELLMDLVWLSNLLHPDQETPSGAIPLSQTYALHAIDTNASLSQRDLARRLRLEKSTVSRLVADMEQAGLLVRDRDPVNRRYVRLRATDRGRAAHARMGAQFHDRYVRLVSGMTTAEREALLTGLPALVRALREELG